MSEKMTVTAKIPANKEKGTSELGPASVTVNTGATAKEMIQMFGDEAVKSNSNANWTVTVASAIRSGLKRGETQKQLQERLGGAKMGVATKGVKVDPVQAYLALLDAASPEEQAKMIADVQERAQKK